MGPLFWGLAPGQRYLRICVAPDPGSALRSQFEREEGHMNPLERAADLIEERGWCRGRFRDDTGRICIDFALVTADIVNNAQTRDYVLEELHTRGVRCQDLTLWNDFEADDIDDVVDLLRHAAKRWTAAHVPTA